MIEQQNILKESEFKWLVDSGHTVLIQNFLENKIVFLKNVNLETTEGQNILKYIKNKITGLVYIEFKTGTDTSGLTVKTYDKIYFQSVSGKDQFISIFENKKIPSNVIKVFDD